MKGVHEERFRFLAGSPLARPVCLLESLVGTGLCPFHPVPSRSGGVVCDSFPSRQNQLTDREDQRLRRGSAGLSQLPQANPWNNPSAATARRAGWPAGRPCTTLGLLTKSNEPGRITMGASHLGRYRLEGLQGAPGFRIRGGDGVEVGGDGLAAHSVCRQQGLRLHDQTFASQAQAMRGHQAQAMRAIPAGNAADARPPPAGNLAGSGRPGHRRARRSGLGVAASLRRPARRGCGDGRASAAWPTGKAMSRIPQVVTFKW